MSMLLLGAVAAATAASSRRRKQNAGMSAYLAGCDVLGAPVSAPVVAPIDHDGLPVVKVHGSDFWTSVGIGVATGLTTAALIVGISYGYYKMNGWKHFLDGHPSKGPR